MNPLSQDQVRSVDPSISLASGGENNLSPLEKFGLAVMGVSLLVFIVGAFGAASQVPLFFLVASFGTCSVGALLYLLKHYLKAPPGVKNNNLTRSNLFGKGSLAWLLMVVLMGFYILMYWYPSSLKHLVRMVDPLSLALRNKPAEQYFLYGTLYTFAIVVMGFRAVVKYRHSRYQIVRTLSIIFFQSVFAYLLPGLLVFLKEPERYLNYFWPLSYKDMFPENVQALTQHPGSFGVFLLLWTAALSFVAVPVLTYFYGKRWYCSWVCGCGGLANTLGDPWRQHSSKSLKSWKLERLMIYSVLLFIVATTGLLWLDLWKPGTFLGPASKTFRMAYGTAIGMVFAGVVGTGFYPIFGTRVWCRFGCPQAAILGILQRWFSRFRITTNGSQCISCGNCSTYCEMGIDVRWYAQRGQNIVRASCVGCGLCSVVCPRGVLNLENGRGSKNRVLKPIDLTQSNKGSPKP